MLNLEGFTSLVVRRFHLSLYCTVNCPILPRTKKDRKQKYTAVMKEYTKGSLYVGNLSGGHGITMFAMFGILPTWFISFRTVQKSQVSVQRYSASHDLGITTEVGAASFFDSIRLALSNSVGHDLDENEVEHGLCKTSCVYAADPKENRKAMYLVPGQPLFHIYNRTKIGIERCNIDVMSSSNEITDLYRKTLLTTFPCKDEYNRSTHSSLSNICEHGSISSIM